ncbi:MAG: response regulator [Acetobacteraceae bacterium]|nr:response regulator [Acetobacteraceae bacterium]
MLACRALLLAPHGRDAAVAAALLREIGIPAKICIDLSELQDHVDDDAAFALLTEEVINFADLQPLADLLRAQPAWSDLPFIIMTHHGGGSERNPRARHQSELLGNVTFLERPFHPATFRSVAQTALRSRQRQYEIRTRMQEIRESEERLQRLNETLEELVFARTAELEAAHAAVLAEIAQREQAEERLRQSQKMETLGQLTGGVAHDFNNLLTAVIGNLALLSKYLRDDPKVERLLRGAIEGAQRGAALTQRLLAFAHRQDLKVEPRNLVDLIRGMRSLIERSIGSGIALDIDLPAMLPPVLVDANQIELALLNVIVNARDAMPQGGRLSIRVNCVQAAGDDDLAPGHYARVTVIDTGQGMDATTLQRATEPFFSTKGIGRGTGLGLSMVHGLAKQLHGTLRLTSKVGHGTQVELWLPTTAAAVPAESIEVREQPSNTVSQAIILLVDDDVLVAMTTAAMLKDLGHEVIETHSGDSALTVLRQGQAIDLLITDYSMPNMNGSQLAKAAREMHPDLPILLATGFAEMPDYREMDVPHITKPFQQDLLAREIGRLLQSNADRE